MSGIFSPDAANLSIGRGFALFRQDGTTTFKHLGNCPKIVYTSEVNVLEHWNVQAGTKIKDQIVILQKGGKMSVTMEESTYNNLLLFYLGAGTSNDSAGLPAFEIYGQISPFQGEFRFISSNDVGPRWNLDLTRVSIHPTGAVEFIDENAYHNFTVEMEHIADDNLTFGTMSLQPAPGTTSPNNYLLPFIVGSLNETTQPFAPLHGETLTCNLGAWVGFTTFAFQWLKNNNPISGATAKTYVPVAGDVGGLISCAVTATNPIGSTTATSIQSLAVT